MHRRDFLSASPLALGLVAPGLLAQTSRLAQPIPQTHRNIRDYGALPDSTTLNTKSIQRAIDDVFAAGGGLVYCPPGTFLIGGLELKARVTLYLEAGCTLLGSTNIADYPYFSGPPPKGDANGHHVLFARDADDITLAGLGTIDGQGQSFWTHLPRPIVPEEKAWADSAAFYYKPTDARPSPMVEFVHCNNLRITGITLKNASGWTLRPINCEGVVIDGLRVRNPNFGPNTDGMDITGCRNVFVSNCDIQTGDDAICIKSENPYGSDVLPTKNITITNCVLTTCCNGLKLGTATHGAFENIVFSNSVIYNDDSAPLRDHVIGGINLEMVDGGSIDGIVCSNIRMQNTRTPIFIRLGARTPRPGSFVRNILIQNIDATGVTLTSSITGVDGLRPHDITVADCRFRTVEAGTADWTTRTIPEVVRSYPESRMFGHLPASGFYIRHADRIRLRNLELITDKPDQRPAIVCDDVEDIHLNNLEVSAPSGPAPLIDLRNTRRAWITNMRAPTAATIITQVSGAASKDNAHSNLQLAPHQTPITYTQDAPKP